MENNLYSDGFEHTPPPAKVEEHLYDTVSAALEMVGSVAKASGDITKSVMEGKIAKTQLAGKKTDLATAIIGGKTASQSANITAQATIAAGASQQKTIILVAVIISAVIGLGIFAYFELSEDKIAAPVAAA